MVEGENRLSPSSPQPCGRLSRQAPPLLSVRAQRGSFEVHADELVRSSPPLEPSCEPFVELGPLAAGNSRVGRIADECVDELVPVSARDHESPSSEGRQPSFELGDLGVGGQRANRVVREGAPHDGRSRKNRVLAGLQPVDTAREQRLEGRRQALIRKLASDA